MTQPTPQATPSDDNAAGRPSPMEALAERGATAEELQQLSMELNVGLSTLGVDPKARTWFALFRYMDEDESGLISYY